MEIISIADKRFQKYGRVVKDVDFTGLLEALKTVEITEEVVYEPSVGKLEAAMDERGKQFFYGELPVQIGYCGGHNKLLNAVEYHRNSEINVAGTDAILILGMQQDITEDYQYDTSKMEAFLVPQGTAVELYATTLHYAPCQAGEEGFMVAVILPKGTNEPLAKHHEGGEDSLLAAANKWLIGHPEGGLPEGSHIGLIGKNLSV